MRVEKKTNESKEIEASAWRKALIVYIKCLFYISVAQQLLWLEFFFQ